MEALNRWRTANSEASWYRWLIFGTVASGTFMVNVDGSVMNVALPALERQFAVGPALLQWVISGYLLIITGILPVVGALSDRLNRKRVFLAGVTFFTSGSILCAFSSTIDELILFRIFQSLGGAVIMGNVMSIVAHIFPAGERGRPIGLIGSVVAAGTIVGPSVGGLLIAAYGWPSIFWVNVPVGVVAVVMTQIVLGRMVSNQSTERFDSAGAILFFVGIVSLMIFVSEGTTWGWASASSWLSLALALTALPLFIWRELRAASPVIELSLFRSGAFSIGNIAGYLSYVMFMFPGFILPLYMQHVLRIPTAHIGMLLTPQAVFMIVVSPFGGRLTDKVGANWPAFAGMAMGTVGLWMMTRFTSATSYTDIVIALSVFGAGMGLFTSPNTVAVLESAPISKSGLTGSLIATVRNFGRVSGIAVAVLLLQSAGVSIATVAGFTAATAYAFNGSVAIGALGVVLTVTRLLQKRAIR